MKKAPNNNFLSLPYFDALRLANPLYDSLPRATFHGTTEEAWMIWSRKIFRETLYPALQTSIQLAASGRAEELRGLEDQISEPLSVSSRRRSLAAGRCLLLSLTVPRGEKVLEKLVRGLQTNPSQGCHLVIAYAARCAAFHFPPPLCIASYVYQEAWAAFPSSADSKFSEYIDTALREASWERQADFRAA
jgi:hypothetical protein